MKQADFFEEGIEETEVSYKKSVFERTSNYQHVISFINNYENEKVDYVFISGGGISRELYNEAKKKISAKIFLDIPDLSKNIVEENPTILHYRWQEAFSRVLNEDPELWEAEYDVQFSISGSETAP